MKIQEQDMYHGAVLTQIVQASSFKAVNRGSTKYGHYRINDDRDLFVKYLKKVRGPWTFTTQASELAAMQAVLNSGRKLFLCLVCGKETICVLTSADISAVMDLSSSVPQWLRVEVPPGASCHVSGSTGALPRAIAHSAFPRNVFR